MADNTVTYPSKDELLKDIEKGYYILSTEKWSYWSMIMEDGKDGNLSGVSGDPGEQGYWKFTKEGSDPDDFYLMSPKKWPNWYAYMEDKKNGNVRGSGGNPGPQGHWYITPKGLIRLEENGPYVPYFLLSPRKWNYWHMFVDDDKKGNVIGASGGDPGPQAHILMKKVPDPK